MKRHWFASIAAIAAVLALTACAAKDERLAELPSAGEIGELGLFVDGEFIDKPERADEIFTEIFGIDQRDVRRRDAVRELLSRLDQGEFVAKDPDRLGIEGIEQSDIDLLSGLSGFTMAELAHLALNPRKERRTNGLIGDYLVIHDENVGRGHLSFDLETKIENLDITILRHYDIEVPVKGFKVVKREGPPGNPDPFPGTVQLPGFMLDPMDPNERSIWQRDLDHKLFAVGENVVITRMYIQINDGEIMEIADGDSRRISDDVSCLDLMTQDPPPTHRIDEVFRNQSIFCLGGCFRFIRGTRDIINSV